MKPAFTGEGKTRNDLKRLSFTLKQRTPLNIPLVASFYYVVKKEYYDISEHHSTRD